MTVGELDYTRKRCHETWSRKHMKFAERAQQLRPSLTLAISAKARDLQQQGEDVCSLSTGEPDFATPSFICRAAEEAMGAGHTRYGPAAGEPALREAIANKLQQDNKLTYGPGEIMVSNGAKQALYTLFQVLLDPGDEVILPAPYWLSYPPMVHLAGGRSVIVPTRQEENHQLGAAALAAAITPRTRLLVLNSPTNPTGTVYPEQALAELASVLRQHPQVAVVSDEIYEYILYDHNRHVSFGAVAPDLAERTFVVNGFSKNWAHDGLAAGLSGGSPTRLGQSRGAPEPKHQQRVQLCAIWGPGGTERLTGVRPHHGGGLCPAPPPGAPGHGLHGARPWPGATGRLLRLSQHCRHQPGFRCVLRAASGGGRRGHRARRRFWRRPHCPPLLRHGHGHFETRLGTSADVSDWALGRKSKVEIHLLEDEVSVFRRMPLVLNS